jgi:hypothetical protein
MEVSKGWLGCCAKMGPKETIQSFKMNYFVVTLRDQLTPIVNEDNKARPNPFMVTMRNLAL